MNKQKDYCMECLQVNNAITRLKRYRDVKEENKKLNIIIENTGKEQKSDREHIEELEEENQKLKERIAELEKCNLNLQEQIDKLLNHKQVEGGADILTRR